MNAPLITENERFKWQKLIAKQARKFGVKGLSYAVVQDDSTVFEYHYGTVTASNRINDGRQKMMIGSNTKLLTALAILQLYEQRRVSLDAPITDYLKDLKLPAHQDYPKMTVRDVMQHMSGLPSDDFALLTDSEATLADLPKRLASHHLVAPPQHMPAYSNIGYGLLGLVIEAVSGLTYEQYVEARINSVLGTHFQILETRSKRDANQEMISASFDKKGREVEDPLAVLISAGSSTYATLDDLKTLMQVFMRPERQKLLREETIRLMMTPPDPMHESVDHERTGLGMRHGYIKGYDARIGSVMGHGGNTLYHHSTFDLFPKQRLGLIAMSNSERGMAALAAIHTKMRPAIFQAQGLTLPVIPKPVPFDTQKAPVLFAKTYVAPGLKLTIKQKANRHPELKFLIFTLALKRCVDGFYQVTPRGLARFPLIAKMVKRIRFKPAYQGDLPFLYIEQNSDHFGVIAPFAGAYAKTEMPPSWRRALGSYEAEKTTASREPLVDQAQLTWKKEALILSFKAMNSRMRVHLKVLNDHQAIVQGYGRMAGDTVTFTCEEDRCVLRFYGVAVVKK